MVTSDALSTASSLTSYSIVIFTMDEPVLSFGLSFTSMRTLYSVNPKSRYPPSTISVSLTMLSLSIIVYFSL
ncbi:hypothetical protein HanXRQr2_Chr11g0510901 [Helianthus annuus]|uniref:Uncharacterized protein n=1 Tax=Helianthus annuus TaxID=4232 RepID=A0A9K3N1L3_HELAN|nr:hypothetical protein HanXRQr2_Chr11g0510901 [Helianthus annuus]KAJ0876761.1 hypothetical protein HanPSC8_Chr11g0492141 [Helianthus annuus]